MTAERPALDPARLAALRAAGLNERSRIAHAMAAALFDAARRLVAAPVRLSRRLRTL
jgi:hypothetical protein